uniref:Uncharacterized protein n=1 Tax=Siphoviridae sp. ctmIh35 TaxID=2827932 RepID=A0A8S5T9Z4_9CAUD|nr:MAG TPA: hypothetical protein [Siphoviridae sp. ctmIh35]
MITWKREGNEMKQQDIEARLLFRQIGIGRERAIKRPENRSLDRKLRRLIAEANAQGCLIINVGSGIYIPRLDVPEEDSELREYIAKETSRGMETLKKARAMNKAYQRLKAVYQGQMSMEDYVEEWRLTT